MNSQWIFLRGLARESKHWGDFPQKFTEHFSQDGEKAAVACLDLPGTGTNRDLLSPWSIQGIVDFLHAEFAKQKIANRSAFLFSISLGSMVATEWLNRYPQDFKGAILINTSFKGWSPFYQRLRPGAFKHIAKVLMSTSAVEREAEILKMVSNRTELHQELAKTWAALLREHPISSVNGLRQLIAAATYRPPHKAPPVPVLILSSQKDQMVDSACSELIASRWQAPIRRHVTAGHELVLDAPEWTLHEVESWFRENQDAFI